MNTFFVKWFHENFFKKHNDWSYLFCFNNYFCIISTMAMIFFSVWTEIFTCCLILFCKIFRFLLCKRRFFSQIFFQQALLVFTSLVVFFVVLSKNANCRYLNCRIEWLYLEETQFTFYSFLPLSFFFNAALFLFLFLFDRFIWHEHESHQYFVKNAKIIFSI